MCKWGVNDHQKVLSRITTFVSLGHHSCSSHRFLNCMHKWGLERPPNKNLLE